VVGFGFKGDRRQTTTRQTTMRRERQVPRTRDKHQEEKVKKEVEAAAPAEVTVEKEVEVAPPPAGVIDSTKRTKGNDWGDEG
jgi:hypothetical protein